MILSGRIKSSAKVQESTSRNVVIIKLFCELLRHNGV